MRRKFDEELRLSLKARIIIIASGLVLLLAGLFVADFSLLAGIIVMAIGVLAAFFGIGRGGGADIAFRRGAVHDPRKSETRAVVYADRENPWDEMDKGKKK